MAAKLYFHNAANALSGTFPTGEQASWTKDGVSGSDTLKTMNTTIGTAQASLVTGANGSATVYEFFGFFCSPPVAGAQTVGGGAITLNAAEAKSNNAASFIIDSLNAYVWRPSTGALVGVIREGADLGGTTPTTNNSEQVTHITGITSTAVSMADADVIIAEVWGHYTTGSNPNNATFYFDGTTENTTENAVVSNHASFIQFTENLTFAGAGTSYTYTADGGAASGGVAPPVLSVVPPASGGAIAAGVAALVLGVSLLASGGMQSGGLAGLVSGSVVQASGGAQSGGVADVTFTPSGSGVVIPGGGFGGQSFGEAPFGALPHPAPEFYSYTADGGAVAGGSAFTTVAWSLGPATGGAQSGGAATFVIGQAPKAAGGAQSGGAAAFATSWAVQAGGGAQSGGSADVAIPTSYPYVADGGAQSGGSAAIALAYGHAYIGAGGAQSGGAAFALSGFTGRLLTVRLHDADGAPRVGAEVLARRVRVGGAKHTVVVPEPAQALTDVGGVAVLTLMPSLGDAYRVTATAGDGTPLLDVAVLVGPGDGELHSLPRVEDLTAWH